MENVFDLIRNLIAKAKGAEWKALVIFTQRLVGYEHGTTSKAQVLEAFLQANQLHRAIAYRQMEQILKENKQ